MEGKRLGHYELRELLGKGGMGEVWLARDHKLERDVALKFLHPGLGLDEEAEERLLREARAASALDHPGILTIHAIEREDGRTFIVMERLLGSTIAEGSVGIAPDAAAARIEQAADALAAAHARGIVHRDIKPTNLFVDGRGRVVLMDFGLARVLDAPELTRSGTTLGTLGYMAPEQLRGQEATATSDVFGLGAVLYELLAGKPAFDPGQGPGGIIRSILEEDAPPLEGVDPVLASVVERSMAKSAADRYQDAAELREAIRTARASIAASTGTHTAGTAGHGNDPPPRGRPSWLLALVASAIAAALALGIWKFSGGRGPVLTATTWQQQDVGLLSMRVEQPQIAPDGKSLVFVERGTGLPQVFIATLGDPSPRALTDASTFPEGATSPAWAPDGGSILVESVAGKEPQGAMPIFSVPILGGEPRPIIEFGETPSYGTPEHIVYERTGSIWVHRIDTGESERVLSMEDTGSVGFSVHPAMDPSGNRIAFVRSQLGPLGAIDLFDRATGKTRVLVQSRATHTGLTFTPSGDKLLFSSDMSGAANLWSVDLSTGALERLTSGAGDDISPSSAGNQILYQNRRDDYELVRLDPKDGSEEVLFRSRSPIFGARLAPSGGGLLFSAQIGAAAEACILMPGDRAPRRVTQGGGALYLFPRWLSDSSIMCYRDTEEGSDLIRVDVVTGAESVLVEGWSMQTHPYAEPSPDGSRIAVFQTPPGPGTLIFDTSAGPAESIKYPCFLARWSADGETVTANSFRGQILTAPSRGEWRPTTVGNGENPTFSPSDGSIIFAQPLPGGGSRLLRVAPGSGGKKILGEVNGTLPETTSFEVDSSGRVIYVRFVPRTSEAWLLKPQPE